MKKILFSVFTLAILGTSFNTYAHLNIASENFFTLGDNPRDYKEGSSVFLSINAVEGCADAFGIRYDTTDVVVVLPTTPGALSDNFYTSNRDGEIFGANAMMFTKARATKTWRKVGVVKGSVDEFRGRTEGVRAIKWRKGRLDSDHYDNLEFRTSLPKILPTSCVGKLRVELPTISYCERRHIRAWIGTEGSARFPVDSDKLQLEESYELYFNIVRDVENNPYPETCEIDIDGNIVPVEETVRPSDADIDFYGGRRL